MKHGFRIGMREKVAALVTVLVTLVGLLLPGHLFRSSRAIVEEHEIVDLRDEGVLRAWELVGRVDLLVDDVRGLARDADWVARRAGGGADWTDGLRLPLHGDPDDYVRVELVAADGATAVVAGDAPVAAGGAGGPADPRAALLAEVQADGAAGEVYLSPIHHAVIAPAAQPRPVIWAAARSTAVDDGPIVLVLLDLELILGTNRADPRHLYLLAREESAGGDGPPALRFVVHPDSLLERRAAPIADDTLFPPAAGLVQALRDSKPNVSDTRTAVQGIADRLGGVPLAADYYFVEGTPDARLRALIDRQTRKMGGDKQLAKQIRESLQQFSREMGANSRINLPQNAVSQVRVLAESRAAAERIMAEYPSRLAALLRQSLGDDPPPGLYQEGERPAINWGEPVHCRMCDIWLAHLRLRGQGNEHAYRLAYAAFREELNYAITEEFGGLRLRALLFGLLAGLLSFLLALWFIRPLDRITRTAGSAAESAALHERMQEKINEVRESLPVRRGDEVGDIARALERLLREALNGHERLRQAKVDLDRQVAEQTQELREKNAQLEQLARDKDAFLGNVSHELRQPLNALFGFTQLLELSDLDDGQRQDLGKIRKEAQHLLDLINDILDYQKIIMEGLELEPDPIALGEFLDGLRDSMAAAAERGNNRLVVACEDCPERIRNDPKRLRQVLVNLLSNACKFTRDGVITLRVRPQRKDGRDWIMLDVADTGRGMKPAELARLFTKFAKLSSKEGNPGGTGLGLVISKGLCELMGGSITVTSEFGQGTTFTVRVPALVGAEQEPPEPAAPPAATGAAGQPRHRRERPLVLVVDDDDAVCELISRFLGGAGMDTLTAVDGATALALAAGHLPDVITLDAVMPEMDGWDVLSALKSAEETARIPVVMVSFLEQHERGYALGAADYVVKPIDWHRLAEVIERHLDGHRDAAILVVDDDDTTREIFRRTLEGAGWQVREAADGREALAALAERLPSMILLDLMMPVMDGFEFIEEYRLHPEWHAIPVVVVTARDPSAEEKQRLEGSVVRILHKGASHQQSLLEQIKAQVELQLRPPGPPSGAT
jgi:signal transduction histidine kinase/DNA-binding response OmpR family regulator